MKTKQIADIDTALKLYYMNPELNNAQISNLFGGLGKSTIAAYKNAVLQEQAERGVKTAQWHTVNTTVAYEVWGIDVPDLERRRAKLKKLGLSA